MGCICPGLSSKRARVLMVGLDKAGKTTILYTLKLGDVVKTIPTVGFNVETVKYKKINFTVWDVGGGEQFRGLWRHYYKDSDAVIFVIDSSDADRLDSDSKESGKGAKSEMEAMLKDENLPKNAILLIFANKQDVAKAVRPREMAERLELSKIVSGRLWHIQGSSAINGKGIHEGLDWLAKNIGKKPS